MRGSLWGRFLGQFSGSVYGLLLIVTNDAILFYPYIEPLSLAAQASLFFIANLFLALIALFWPQLKPGHILFYLSCLILTQILPFIFPESHFPFRDRYFPQFMVALSIQTSVCLILSSALWMKNRRSNLQFYRVEPTRQEMEKLYAIKIDPTGDHPSNRTSNDISSDISNDISNHTSNRSSITVPTYYAYNRFLKKCISHAAIENGKLLSALHLLKTGERLFALQWLPENGNMEEMNWEGMDYFLSYLFACPEFYKSKDVQQQIVFVLYEGEEQKVALLKQRGFHLLQKNEDGSLITELEEQLNKIFRLDFSNWTPVDKSCLYMLHQTGSTN